MLIISIDTSTRGCSVALHENGTALVCYDLHTPQSSSALLTTLIQNAVDHAGVSLSQLDAVAVAKGPGSYTGLRVGVSTAKGLCYALDRPLIAVNTLEAMAAQVVSFYPSDTLFCPMLDARRMEVYCALYDARLDQYSPTAALIVEESSFVNALTEKRIVFFGDGAGKCESLLGENTNALFCKEFIQPSARTIGERARLRYVESNFEDVVTFEPYYLKDFMGVKKKPLLADQ